jgi:hypothetical protein
MTPDEISPDTTLDQASPMHLQDQIQPDLAVNSKKKLARGVKEVKKAEAVQCHMVSLANLVVRRQKELQMEQASGEKIHGMRGKSPRKKTAQTGLTEQRKVPKLNGSLPMCKDA